MLPLRTPVVPVSIVVSSALGPFSEIHMCMPSRWTHMASEAVERQAGTALPAL